MVNYQLHDLPDDPDGQVAETIRIMTAYVDADRNSPDVQARAREVLSGAVMEPVDSVWHHVRNSMRFKNDDVIHGRVFGKWQPAGMGDVVEVLSRPADTAVAVGRGFRPEEDCDGYSTYAAGLLACMGIPCAFATVGADPENPDRYSHVYVVAYPTSGAYAGQRVAMDCSHGSYSGWECPNRYGKFREWPVYGRMDWTRLAMVGLLGYGVWRWLSGKPLVPAFVVEAFQMGGVD